MLTSRVLTLEEELQSRIIDGEEIHQQNSLLLTDRQSLTTRLSQLDAHIKDRERALSDSLAKAKEFSVNLHLEQEASAKLRFEREAMELELQGLREDLAIARQSQSQSSDMVG